MNWKNINNKLTNPAKTRPLAVLRAPEEAVTRRDMVGKFRSMTFGSTEGPSKALVD